MLRRLREELRRAMVEEEIRKVDRWTARYKLVEVDFSDAASLAEPIDLFFNTNRPDDLEEAGRSAATLKVEIGLWRPPNVCFQAFTRHQVLSDVTVARDPVRMFTHRCRKVSLAGKADIS